MKALTDIGLVALGLVVGVVLGQLLHHFKPFLDKIFKNKHLTKI
jgi:hypothetical protein